MDTETSVKELRSGVQHALTDPLDDHWEEVLDQWEEASPSMREKMLKDLNYLRDHMLDVLLEIESKDGLQQGVAFQYVAMKGHWATILAQIHSQTENQQGTERLIYRASCMSVLIQRLEALLCWEDIDEITAFLDTPLWARVGGSNSKDGRFGGGPIDES